MARKTTNPVARYSTITLKGIEYKLAFDFNALAQAEADTKLNLLSALDFIGLDIQKYRALLYATMLKFQPEMTIEEAGALIGLDVMPRISEAIVEAWKLSMPDPEPGKSARPPQPESDPA